MSQTFNCISPVDGRVYVSRTYATERDLVDTLQRAIEARNAWRAISVSERARFCSLAIDSLLSKKDIIAEEITRQMGRPIRYSAGELNGFEERGRYMISIAASKLQDIELTNQSGFKRCIRREPQGVVLSITPWNYPYLTAVNSVIPALMAGNVVVMKTSMQTPLVSERLDGAFRDAGLPAGVFQYLHMDHEMTARAIQSGQVNYVSFTGSTQGGAAIEKSAAGYFLEMSLELGGNDPAYVRNDADIAHAVENLVDGAYFNSGQSCCGIERIYVHRNIYEDFVARFIALVETYKLGDPLDPETSLGPVVSAAAADELRHLINNTLHIGAHGRIAKDLFPKDEGDSAYLAPQVFTHVEQDMSVMRNESFGPVVSIMAVEDDAQAVELMNQSQYGLTASIWTRDMEAALLIGDQLQSGTVFMNRCDYLDPGLAWSGYKKSGKGCSLSELAYERLTRPKSFHFRELG